MNDMHIMARILAAVRANEGNLVFNTSLVDEKVIKTDAKTVERCTIFSGSFKRNGKASQTFSNGKVDVTVNPETGMLVQTNPSKRKINK